MIDIQTVKDCYHTNEVNDVALVRSEYNVADTLSKVKANPALLEPLKTGNLHHAIEQWNNYSKLNEISAKKKGGLSIWIVTQSKRHQMKWVM